MKIVLKNGAEYSVSSVFNISDTQICIGFTGIESYDSLRQSLTLEDMKKIKYYIDDTNYEVYENYTTFTRAATVETESGIIDIAMYFEKVDAITQEIQTVRELVSDINNKINPSIDLDTCTLEELKAYQPAKSKENLETYLSNNPIASSCHGEVEKQYTITKEKQSLLTQAVLITQMAIQTGIEYKPSWNAVGEPCTYDWTLEELLQLAFEIETVVRPLVSHQQTLEADINTATTKEAVLAISIEF